MYEERRENNTLRDIILQLLFVVLFVFVLCWLFPTKSYLNQRLDALESNNGIGEYGNKIDALTARLFQENIDTMKDAAKTYFTTPRLPQKTGDTVKLTLREMLDKNLLLTLYDKNNDTCSTSDSYVEIAKADDEYVMKVNLKCGDEEAYVLEHLGCYDYCKTTLCAKQDTTSTVVIKPITVVKKYMYQYKLVTNGKWGEYGNWSNWGTNVITANDYTQVDVKTEQVFDHYEQVYGIVGYKNYTTSTVNSCPSGYYDNGSYCIKTVSTSGTTVYANYINSCPSGYSDNGSYCVKTVSGGTSYQYAAYTKSCPSGYSLTPQATQCYKTITTSNGTSKTYVGRQEFTSTRSNTSTYNYTFISSRKEVSCTSSCKTVNYYTYDVYKISANTSTSYAYADFTKSCPSGYSLTSNGAQCFKSVSGGSSTVTAAYTKTCPSGYYNTGSNCAKTTSGSTNTLTANYTKTCSSGYTLSGSTCYKKEAVYGYTNGEAIYKTVKYYRSRVRQYISGTVDYKWSYSNSDSSLLNQGYSLTGVTKEA